MTKQLNIEEIYSKIKADYDIESLMSPYLEGGTESQPIERSSGTILDWLINKKKFSPEIAGAGFISILMELKQGNHFKGDGSYGSKGHEFVHAIAKRCDEFNKKNLKVEIFKTIAGAKLEVMEEAIFEMVRFQLPWFIVLFAPKSWKWLRKKRKNKNEPS